MNGKRSNIYPDVPIMTKEHFCLSMNLHTDHGSKKQRDGDVHSTGHLFLVNENNSHFPF